MNRFMIAMLLVCFSITVKASYSETLKLIKEIKDGASLFKNCLGLKKISSNLDDYEGFYDTYEVLKTNKTYLETFKQPPVCNTEQQFTYYVNMAMTVVYGDFAKENYTYDSLPYFEGAGKIFTQLCENGKKPSHTFRVYHYRILKHLGEWDEVVKLSILYLKECHTLGTLKFPNDIVQDLEKAYRKKEAQDIRQLYENLEKKNKKLQNQGQTDIVSNVVTTAGKFFSLFWNSKQKID